jgi:hypothetical protein
MITRYDRFDPTTQMLPAETKLASKIPDHFNTKDNTEALIVQERSTFAHLARHTLCEMIQKKIERDLAPSPCR